MPANDACDTIWFVGAGPGDPELITVKGRNLLDQADLLLYAGSLVSPALVASSPAPEKVDSWGMHLEDMVNLMADHAARGKRVVRLHSGDPALFGSIVEQIAELGKRALFIPTPGQTEQEYLSGYYEKKGWFHSVSQYDLSLPDDIAAAKKFAGFPPVKSTEENVERLYHEVLREYLS